MNRDQETVMKAIDAIGVLPEGIQKMTKDFTRLIEKSMEFIPMCAMSLALEAHGMGEKVLDGQSKILMDELSHFFGALHQDYDDAQRTMKIMGPETESNVLKLEIIKVMTKFTHVTGIVAALYLQQYLAKMQQLVEASEEVEQ